MSVTKKWVHVPLSPLALSHTGPGSVTAFCWKAWLLTSGCRDPGSALDILWLRLHVKALPITAVSILPAFCNSSTAGTTECVVLVNTEQIPNSLARYLEQTLCAYNTLINKIEQFRLYEAVVWRTEIFCLKRFPSSSWETDKDPNTVIYYVIIDYMWLLVEMQVISRWTK